MLANSGAPREFHLHVPSPRWGRYLRVAIAVAARSKRPDETMQVGHQRMCTVNRRDQHGVYHGKERQGRAFFFFLYFLKLFFTEIYFRFYNLQFCTPTARLRGGQPTAALLPGGRDLNVNKIYI